MGKIKVMTIFGTRPECIKMAPVVAELKRHSSHFESIVCVTAQHREILDQELKIFGIKPDYDLHVMKKDQTLCDVTSLSLSKLNETMDAAKPDAVLVQGDTTTAFAGALAAFYHKIPVGHIEAGLRTFNKYDPFPEEINRKMIGTIADFHFAPTNLAKQNLLKENIVESSIFVTGNTVIDAMKTTVSENYTFNCEALRNFDFSGKTILVTAHRRESFGKSLENICHAILELVRKFSDVKIIYPVHPNPNVNIVVRRILGNVERITLTDPVDVFDLHNIMSRCYMVMTDSGGIQEEAPHLGKPVVVLRNETERPEGIAAGCAVLGTTDMSKIVKIAANLLTDAKAYNAMKKVENPYGDGHAAERIVNILKKKLGGD